jgi:hypothetical protein
MTYLTSTCLSCKRQLSLIGRDIARSANLEDATRTAYLTEAGP